MAKKSNFDVGYGKPPRHTRFKPGQSGNPKGRPKGTRNLATDLEEELREIVTIREGGRVKKFSKQRIMIKATMANSMKGSVPAFNAITALRERLLTVPEDEAAVKEISPNDAEILKDFAIKILEEADQEQPKSGTPKTNSSRQRGKHSKSKDK